MNKKTKEKINNWLFLSLSILLISCTEPNDPPYSPPINYKEKITVVIIGSSIASGQGASNYSNSWAGTLQAVTKDSIINNAVGGYTTFHFLPETIPNKLSIETDVKRNISTSLKLNPDLIIFSITTNDIAKGFTIADYINNMKIMTDLCRDNHIEALVTSTTPRTDLPYEKRKMLYDLNRELERIYGDNFTNVYSSLAEIEKYQPISNLFTTDLIHPNNEGHEIIFNTIYPAYLKLKSKIVNKI